MGLSGPSGHDTAMLCILTVRLSVLRRGGRVSGRRPDHECEYTALGVLIEEH